MKVDPLPKSADAEYTVQRCGSLESDEWHAVETGAASSIALGVWRLLRDVEGTGVEMVRHLELQGVTLGERNCGKEEAP